MNHVTGRLDFERKVMTAGKHFRIIGVDDEPEHLTEESNRPCRSDVGVWVKATVVVDYIEGGMVTDAEGNEREYESAEGWEIWRCVTSSGRVLHLASYEVEGS